MEVPVSCSARHFAWFHHSFLPSLKFPIMPILGYFDEAVLVISQALPCLVVSQSALVAERAQGESISPMATREIELGITRQKGCAVTKYVLAWPFEPGYLMVDF